APAPLSQSRRASKQRVWRTEWQVHHRFFRSPIAELLVGPTVGYALFCVFQREGKTHRRGFITRIRVPGDDHEKSSYRPRLFALVCCLWFCARYWHPSHSPSLLSKL